MLFIGKKYATRNRSISSCVYMQTCIRDSQNQPLDMFYGKKVFLKISQNSQENTCARVSYLRASFLTVFIRPQALI